MSTAEQREKWRRYQKKYYEEHKAKGLCRRCGGKTLAGRVYCEKCADYYKQTRIFYQKMGFCPICKKNRIYGDEKTCPECLAKKNIQNPLYAAKAKAEGKYWASQEYNTERSRAKYAKRKSEGICTKCGKRPAALDRTMCQICLDKAAERSRRYRERMEAEA